MAYSGVFVFGDSLVDAGNALRLATWYDSLPFTALPEGSPTSEAGYFEGRFSNGYTYADLISNKFVGTVTQPIFPYGFEDPWVGAPIAPFASDPRGLNLNFAYGGAQIRQGSEAVPDLNGQTDAFRNAVDGHADSDALYLITMGGNDVRSLVPATGDAATQAEADAVLQDAAGELYEEIEQLISIGARNILVTGIPDVGLIPKYDADEDGILSPAEQQQADIATLYSQQLDSLIREQIQRLAAAHPEANIHYASFTDATADNLAMLEAIYGRPIDFTVDRDLMFFDAVHPNARSHALLAASFLDSLQGITGNNQLPVTAPDLRLDGELTAAGEVDRVVIALSATATYAFEMLGLSSLGGASEMLADPLLHIAGPSGATVASDDDGGVGLDASLTFTNATGGTYVIQLAGVGSLTGDYSFQVTANAQGNDTYLVTQSSALILERAGGGADTVRSSVSYALAAGVSIETLATTSASDTAGINLSGNELDQRIIGNAGSNILIGNEGDDRLVGNAGDDQLEAGAGNDILDGGAGVDLIYGGAGNDTYYIDNSGDRAIENAGEGTDRVYSSISHSLGANVEQLFLTGTDAINAAGNSLDNVLVGNSATNVLDGGIGADVMRGDLGDDIYYVDNIGDNVIEASGAGRDRIYAEISYNLGANQEDLFARGSSAINLTGNALDNVLRGNSANNILNGRAGADDLKGGTGADTFLFDDGDFGGLTTSTCERIIDFSHADGDIINLSAVDANSGLSGDQAFSFIGTGAFTNVAGQLRYQQINGNTYVYGDTNGDGAADFMIRLDGNHSLVLGDFVI